MAKESLQTSRKMNVKPSAVNMPKVNRKNVMADSKTKHTQTAKNETNMDLTILSCLKVGNEKNFYFMMSSVLDTARGLP
jgi:deoxyxylulose-5-phosphate synthase